MQGTVIRILAVVGALSSLSACSPKSAMSTALDGTATETKALGPGTQRRVLSLYSVGMDPRAPVATPSGQGKHLTPSNMLQTNALHTNVSYYWIEEYEYDNPNSLGTVRKKIAALDNAIVQLMNARIELAAAAATPPKRRSSIAPQQSKP